MPFIETGIEVLRPLHSRPIMNLSASTKVRRKIFADALPLNHEKIERDKARILNADTERFNARFNIDLVSKTTWQGQYEWFGEDAEKVPSFYTKDYPVKKPESLRNHLMACAKNRDQIIIRNNFCPDLFLPLTNLVASCTTGDGQKTTTSTSTLPVLPETPCKGSTLSFRSSRGPVKRKLNPTDDAALDLNEVKGNENLIFPNPSPLRSDSPSETVSSTQLSSQSQDSVGHNLQIIPRTSTTDYQSPSQTTVPTSLLAQQERQIRQTNITEYMKSQKNPTEPVAKHARRA